MELKQPKSLSRRRFLIRSAATASSIVAANWWDQSGISQAPASIISEKMRPKIPDGVASGDISGNSAVIWSRCDRPARMVVEYATNESLRNPELVIGPAALEVSDFTARMYLANLPMGQQIFYRVTFQDLADLNTYSEPVTGTFRTPDSGRRDIRFAWSGCTAGQGWGINPQWGGMKIYETIRRQNPDFFIHCGDYVYADNPFSSEVKLDDGSIWKNLTTPETSKVAETLNEFRSNHRYNLLDEHIRRFNAQVPLLVQWDDHEVHNNWYPGQIFSEDDRYLVKSASLLAARGRRAFLEYTPMGWNARDPERIYRSFQYGKCEIFMLDMRSYRSPNTANPQSDARAETAFMGSQQIEWLKQKLLNSQATWKIIAADMPVGVVVHHEFSSQTGSEALANGDNGPPLGRELEFANLLRFIKRNNIRNVVWLTSDLHYAAAHYYDPAKAQFRKFKPFWEFVAGPLHGGNFGPNELDNTFGPQVMFQTALPEMKINQPPSSGLLFFGTVKIDGYSQVMTVSLHNLEGKTIYSVDLQPEVG